MRFHQTILHSHIQFHCLDSDASNLCNPLPCPCHQLNSRKIQAVDCWPATTPSHRHVKPLLLKCHDDLCDIIKRLPLCTVVQRLEGADARCHGRHLFSQCHIALRMARK